MDGPWRVEAARTTDPTVLLELTAGLRRELIRRGERLSTSWPEEAVADLRTGRLEGEVLRRSDAAVGIGLLSAQPHRAFGHLHLATSEDPLAAVQSLLHRLLASVPPTVGRVDFGLTGVDRPTEDALAESLRALPEFEVIRRFGLFRALSLGATPTQPALPTGYHFRGIHDLPLGVLGSIDWAAFRGSPDAGFISETAEGNLRLLEGIVDGQLGRFLPEASTAVTGPGGVPVGFLLTVEETSRVGVFVDLAVAPEHRRRGLGAALLRRGLRALLALGFAGARLWVTETNLPARRLYESMGFGPDATTAIYRWRRSPPAAAPSPQGVR